MLNRIRSQVAPVVNSIGKTLGSNGTIAELLDFRRFWFAVLAGVLVRHYDPGQPYLAATSILLSGILDILDGAVARVTNKILQSRLVQ